MVKKIHGFVWVRTLAISGAISFVFSHKP